MKLIYITLIGIVFSTLSCNESSESILEPENIVNDLVDLDLPLDTFEESSDFGFIPPSPLQIASIFKKAGMEYNNAIPNPTNNIGNYNSLFEQSLAFGVYSSDLAYCVKNEKYDSATEYLKTIRELGIKIGLEAVFNEGDIIEKFENNIDDNEYIIDLLISIQETTDEYIIENEKNDLSVIYFTGAWIEGIFLGAKTTMLTGDDRVGTLISEQVTIGEMLIRGLEQIKEQNDNIYDLKEAINEIVTTFYNFESVKAVGENIDYIDVQLTQEELNLISGKIIELRNDIVN